MQRAASCGPAAASCSPGDLGIDAEGLRRQAGVGRGAELVAVPDALVLEVYELLRPGRARDAAALTGMAGRLRRDYGAEKLAALIDEAAEVYDRRGLFRDRF